MPESKCAPSDVMVAYGMADAEDACLAHKDVPAAVYDDMVVGDDDDEKHVDPEDMDLFAVAEECALVTPEAVRTPACFPPRDEKDCVMFFDWDDTLLCSTYLAMNGVRLDTDVPADVEAQLRILERAVVHVLETALRTVGTDRVAIVTNAELGWVQLSCQKFLPRVMPLLDYLTVISARSTYERFFPDRPVKWKAHAFMERLNAGFRHSAGQKHVISFGDSHVEREAILSVTRGLSGTKTKSVKFTERSSSDQLRRQLELVSNCFAYICDHDDDLDLALSISPSGTASPQKLVI